MNSIPLKRRGKKRPATLKKEYALIPVGANAKYGYAKVDLKYAYLDEYNWTGSVGHSGNIYACRREAGSRSKVVFLHHVVLKRKNGFLTDHINRDTLDNRTSNLRYSTNVQNTINRKTTNKTTYRGVKKNANHESFMARISYNKKEIYLGNFPTAEEAAKAYNKAAKRYHGEFAQLNST